MGLDTSYTNISEVLSLNNKKRILWFW